MATLEDLMQRNRRFAETGDRSAMAGPPASRPRALTWVGSRVDPVDLFDSKLGEMLAFRNPGGRVADAATDDLALVSFMSEFESGSDVPPPPRQITVSGHVPDLETGLARTVVPASAPHAMD